VVNLHTRIAFGKHAELWARVDNVFDADYETGGIRNFNAFADPIDEERSSRRERRGPAGSGSSCDFEGCA
jgi:hypothetical protein